MTGCGGVRWCRGGINYNVVGGALCVRWMGGRGMGGEGVAGDV